MYGNIKSSGGGGGGAGISNFADGEFYFLEDWLLNSSAGNSGWSSSSLNAASIAAVPISGHLGVIALTRGTTADGTTQINYSGTSYMPFAIRMGFYLQIPVLSDGTNRFALDVGITSATSVVSAINDGMYFRAVDNENAGNWQAICYTGGVGPAADTGIAITTDWVYLEVETNAAGDSVSFYINGTETANSPITSNIPGATRALTFMCRLTGSVGTTSRVVNVDKFYYKNA